MTDWGSEGLGNCVSNSLRFTWETNKIPLICGVVQTCGSRMQAASLRKRGALSRDVATRGGWYISPPPPGFLLDIAATTSRFVGFAGRRPLSWVVAAASRVVQAPYTFCIALRFIKTFQTPKKVRKACSACMEEPMLPQGREGA